MVEIPGLVRLSPQDTATGQDGTVPAFPGRVDYLCDPLPLLRTVEGAHIRLRAETVPDIQGTDAGFEFLHKFTRNFLVDIEALDGRTDLSRIVEPSPQRTLDCLVNVGIVHHDHRVGTPEFQGEVLDVRRCKFPDSPARGTVPGERDLFYLRVFHQRLADHPATAR